MMTSNNRIASILDSTRDSVLHIYQVGYADGMADGTVILYADDEERRKQDEY